MSYVIKYILFDAPTSSKVNFCSEEIMTVTSIKTECIQNWVGGEEKLYVHRGHSSATLWGAYATSASVKGNSFMQ